MNWLSHTIASRRGGGIVFRLVEIKNGKLRITNVINIGIGIIVPAGVETAHFSFDLKYSPNVATRVLKSGYW